MGLNFVLPSGVSQVTITFRRVLGLSTWLKLESYWFFKTVTQPFQYFPDTKSKLPKSSTRHNFQWLQLCEPFWANDPYWVRLSFLSLYMSPKKPHGCFRHRKSWSELDDFQHMLLQSASLHRICFRIIIAWIQKNMSLILISLSQYILTSKTNRHWFYFFW